MAPPSAATTPSASRTRGEIRRVIRTSRGDGSTRLPGWSVGGQWPVVVHGFGGPIPGFGSTGPTEPPNHRVQQGVYDEPIQEAIVADKDDIAGNGSLDRRDFFKGAALGAAGLVVGGQNAAAEAPPIQPAPAVELPTLAHDLAYAMPGQASGPPPARAASQGKPASDFMVDVLKKIGLRVRRHQPGLDVPGASRVAAQLRQQHARRSC